MRALLLSTLSLTTLAGCFDVIDPRWTLDHDHVIAARATPPRVADGGMVTLDALVARKGEAPTLESPMGAELVNDAPNGLTRTLTQDAAGNWHLDIERLQRLDTDAPISVDVMLTFHQGAHRAGGLEPFKVKKTVWVGEPATNPAEPAVLVDGTEIATDGEVVVPVGRDVYIEVPSPAPNHRVNWLTNVGTLFQDDVARAFVHVLPEDARSGQLVVVVRDDAGGVAWRVLPMRAE